MECVSAIARIEREKRVDPTAIARARTDLRALFLAVHEVTPTEVLRERAERCLAVHALRATDSLQLAAALEWSRHRPGGRAFVTLDDRLRLAAAAEGFSLTP